MKVLGSYVAPMYLWAIALLAFLAVTASLKMQEMPANLLVAVASAAAIDVGVKKMVLKRRLSFPYSALISGLIIGSIVPFGSSPVVPLLASAAAMLSKFLIRMKGSHVFNPATFGMLVALSIFSLNDEWWAASSFGFQGLVFAITPILAIATYKAMKLNTAVFFTIVIAILSYSTGFIHPLTSDLNGIVNSLFLLPYYFAFIMVVEPKTSPFKRNEQVVFGVFVAALSFALAFSSVAYSIFIALLIGNLFYALHRSGVLRKLRPASGNNPASVTQTPPAR